jgi:UDP-N-acetyl-2-amino-2-deoxyglucuronate dehydrogenase
MKLRLGIIGPGKVAHLHAQAIRELDEATLVGVCGRSEAKTQDFAQAYGARAYTDARTMVQAEGIDLCIVLTPHPAHRAGAVAALEAGAHVLIEKPLAASLADCDAILDMARRVGRQVGVISQRRWYEACARMKEAIEAGKIGRPALGTVLMLGWRDEAYFSSDPWRGKWATEGGGVLVNQAPHQLDLLLWYMGEIQEVYGFWQNLNHPYIEVEDTAVALVKFKNGGIGNIVVSNSQKPGIYGKVHIHGQNGASVGVQTDGGMMFIAGRSGIAEPPVNDLWTVEGEADQLGNFVLQDKRRFAEINALTHYFKLQIQDCCAAIRQNRPPQVTGDDGRRVVELFTAIYRSNRDNRPVRFPLEPEDTFDGRGE